MIFESDLTVSANTQQASPAELEMDLTHGIIHRLEVWFPPGCRGQVKVVISRNGHQLWPTNADGQLKADAFTISFPVWYELEDRPYKVWVRAWSPGTSYDHNITIRLGVQRREILMPPRAEVGILRRLERLIFGRT